MKILIHDRSGHPFQVQLSRELAGRGHWVLHSYGTFFQSPKGDLARRPSDPASFAIQGITLDGSFTKYAYVRRWFQERDYAKKLVQQITSYKPDVVILTNVPPDAHRLVINRLDNKGIRFIFWMQDVYSVAIKDILSKYSPIVGSAIGRYYSRIERSLLQRSHHIVLITDDFLPLLSRWGIDSSRVKVIPNWAPLDELPLMPRNNSWAAEHGLIGTTCFLYSGTMGKKHNPDLLLQLAISFKDLPVKIVVNSEGIGAEWLKSKRNEHGLSNLIILGFQPYQRMPEVLGAADVLIAILEPDAGVYSVPSKILTYLCAGKPLLLAVPSENLAARTLKQAEAGIVVDPSDLPAFVKAAKQLFKDANLRTKYGRNALRYARSSFDIKKIADQFEQVILVPEAFKDNKLTPRNPP